MKYIYPILLCFFLWILYCSCPPQTASAAPHFIFKRVAGYFPSDTTPNHVSILKKIENNVDSLMKRKYRDSVLRQITKADHPSPPENNEMQRSEDLFRPYSGKIIRNIYYRELNVFGPTNINDTSFHSRMKLLNFANRLHYNTRIWAIRQALFFKQYDTVNAYQLADNERYLRNSPNIEDARILVFNEVKDSVDVEIITKDVFEYGGQISQLSPYVAEATVYNNNLFGAAQGLQFGFLWNKNYFPQWNTEVQYTKYNAFGSFADVGVGYTRLNNISTVDTGVFEGSYYLSINRPLYSTRAKFAGGLSLSKNYSINIYNRNDTVYRNYDYTITDIWAGYNFRNQYRRDGTTSKEPNLAILLKQYNLFFQQRPSQARYQKDPVYFDRRYGLLQFVIFRQDFFKTNRFFGFGKTEDIPLGYTVIAGSGMETYEGVKRYYTGARYEKYFPTPRKGLVDLQAGISSFWDKGKSEDAVIHLGNNYYSRLFNMHKSYLREFFSVDYLNCPNSRFYKPLNINGDNGVSEYRHTQLNGYQRLRMSSQTMYYSPLKIYGFKFNFYALLQAAVLSTNNVALFRNPIYTDVGVGCLIKNENLPINTIKIAALYSPTAPAGVHPLFFQITTTADIHFNIYAIQEPEFLPFQ